MLIYLQVYIKISHGIQSSNAMPLILVLAHTISQLHKHSFPSIDIDHEVMFYTTDISNIEIHMVLFLKTK